MFFSFAFLCSVFLGGRVGGKLDGCVGDLELARAIIVQRTP